MFFKELRLLFEGTETPTSETEGESTSSKVVPEATEEERQAAAEVAESNKNEQEKKIKLSSSTTLDELSKNVADKEWEKLILALQPLYSPRTVNGSINNSLEPDILSLKADLGNKISEETVQAVSLLIETPPVDLKGLLVDIFALGYMKEIKDKISKIDLKGFSDEHSDVPFSYSLTIRGVSDFYVDVAPDKPEDMEAWNEFLNKSKTTDEGTDTNTQQSGEQGKEEDPQIKANADLYRNSKLGKTAGLFFGWNTVDDETGKDTFDRLAEGTADPVTTFIFELFGYGGGEGGIMPLLASFSPKLAASFGKLEKKAKGTSFYNPEALKPGEEVAEEGNYVAADLSLFKIVLNEFKEGSGTLPSEGMKLTEDYMLGKGGNLDTFKVTFGPGGKMILPAGSEVVINGALTTVPEGATKPLSNDPVEIKGEKIPVGTIFIGDVNLYPGVEQNVAEAEKPAETEEPAVAANEPEKTDEATSQATDAPTEEAETPDIENEDEYSGT